MVPHDELLEAEAAFQAGNAEKDQTEHARKKLKLTEADRKRSVRMFGALMGTLSKFQDETSKTRQTEAAQRRAAVENRLQTKLKIESDALHQLRAYELEEKNLKNSVWRKTEQLGHLSEFKMIHFANKLAFSNYLCTSTTTANNVIITDDTDINNRIDSSSIGEGGNRIYWLPNKLLPEQKELIENQRRVVREVVEEEQQAWYEEKNIKQNELDQLISERDIRLKEIEIEKSKSRLIGSSMTDENFQSQSIEDQQQTSSRDNEVVRGVGESPVDDTITHDGMVETDEDAVEY